MNSSYIQRLLETQAHMNVLLLRAFNILSFFGSRRDTIAYGPLVKAECEDAWGWISQLRDAKIEPIPMILHCPACHTRHIDEPNEEWDNPPHKSHLCAYCSHIWRPADVYTTGVREILTRGGNDFPSAPKASNHGLIAALESILSELSHGPQCGCMPCMGACRSKESLEVDIDARVGLAREGLKLIKASRS